jgi:hypothetical protein
VADDSHFFQPFLLKMAWPLWVNDDLRRKKVGKLIIFLLTVPFSMLFFKKDTGPTVTVYVGKSSRVSNCHIVTVGPKFWCTNVHF